MARKADSLHVLPLFCDDLIASCVDMTPACFGAYMRLLCYAWTRGGIPSGLISLPNRYMHSPVEMVNLKDLEFIPELMAGFALSIARGEKFKVVI